MPGLFIFAIITAVLTVGAAVTSIVAGIVEKQRVSAASREDAALFKNGARIITAAFMGVTALCLFFASLTTVGTQNIGILLAFGRPAGDIGNGLHFVAPWKSVVQINGAIQTDTFAGPVNPVTGACDGSIQVRIAQQQTACADVSIRWRVRQDAVDYLFRNYQNNGSGGVFANIQNNLVRREMEVALNQAFQAYSPIDALTSTAREGSAANPTVSQLGKQAASLLRTDIGHQVTVDNILIPRLGYDASVQGRINSVLSQVAQTDVAEQAVKTAQAEATANRALAASVSNDPNVLISRCLDMEAEAAKTGYHFQVGFGCSLFSSGGSTGVLVGGR